MVGELIRDVKVRGSHGFLSFLDGFVDTLRSDLSLDEEMTANIVIALSEALNNAFVHGNSSDESRSIGLKVFKENNSLTFSVSDEGQGFDYGLLREDLSDDLLDIPGGRGIFIMRALADEVDFNDKGNEVVLRFNGVFDGVARS
jgi:serine/threonine-protein kinase RsbW